MIAGVAEREREYRRRLLGSALLVLLIQGALWFLPAPPDRMSGARLGGEGPFRGLALVDVDLGTGSPGNAEVSPADRLAAPAEATPPRPEIEVSRAVEPAPPPPEPRPAALAPATSAVGAAGSPDGSSAGSPLPGGGGAGGSDDGGGTGEEPGPGDDEILSQPRVQVQPSMPAQVARRRIDDFVELQARVGADGRVQEVRILHAIPDCEECTQSAVEAVRRYVYNPPVLAPGESGVWTTPFTLRFFAPASVRER